MPFVLLLPVVGIVALVAVALGVPARRVAVWSGATAAGLVVASAVSLVFIVGIERGEEADGGDVAARVDDGDDGAPALRRVDAELAPADAGDFPDPPVPIDGLADGDTRLLRIVDHHDVTVHQCPADDVRPAACSPGIPARAWSDRDLVVLVQLEASFRGGAGEVDCLRRACAVVAFGDDSEAVAARPLEFGRAVAEPTVRVADRALEPGDVITVRLGSFPPGARGAVTLCVPADDAGAPRCGRPAPVVPFRAGPDGDAEVDVPAYTGAVAGGAGTCARRNPCAVGVVGAPVAAPFAPLRFAPPGGPSVPVERAGAGLTVAALLALAAAVVVRRTDWTPAGGDPFAGVSLGGDPFAGIDLFDDDGGPT